MQGRSPLAEMRRPSPKDIGCEGPDFGASFFTLPGGFYVSSSVPCLNFRVDTSSGSV